MYVSLFFMEQKTHTIQGVTMGLRWMENVGQVSAIGIGAGVCRKVGTGVAGVAGWEQGVQEWVGFVWVVALGLEEVQW